MVVPASSIGLTLWNHLTSGFLRCGNSGFCVMIRRVNGRRQWLSKFKIDAVFMSERLHRYNTRVGVASPLNSRSMMLNKSDENT